MKGREGRGDTATPHGKGRTGLGLRRASLVHIMAHSVISVADCGHPPVTPTTQCGDSSPLCDDGVAAQDKAVLSFKHRDWSRTFYTRNGHWQIVVAEPICVQGCTLTGDDLVVVAALISSIRLASHGPLQHL